MKRTEDATSGDDIIAPDLEDFIEPDTWSNLETIWRTYPY